MSGLPGQNFPFCLTPLNGEGLFKSNGNGHLPVKTKSSPPADKEKDKYTQAVDLLRKSLRKENIPVMPGSRKAWAGHFVELEKSYGWDEIVSCLEWFCGRSPYGTGDLVCSRKTTERLKLPLVSSARQFRVNFEWINSRFKRMFKPFPIEFPTDMVRNLSGDAIMKVAATNRIKDLRKYGL